jgi:membrane-associated phospholipid phosphatase
MGRRGERKRAARWLGALTLRSLALFGAAVLASLLFAAIAAFVRAGALDRLDARVELAAHRLDSGFADAVMLAASRIGSNAVLLPALAGVIALALHHRRRAIALVLAIDAFAVIAAYSALKVMFSRERPQLFDKVALPTGYSFPSGHAMSAIGIYGAMAAALIALYPRARGPVIACAVALIAAIGVSRVYLGVHWPSDVIGGWLAGVPLLVASAHLIHRPLPRPTGR